MIDTPLEKLTAEEAIQAGLMKAVYKNFAIIKGKYLVNNDGSVVYGQKAFFFQDRFGKTRLMKFVSNEEFIKFLKLYRAEYD